MGIADSLSLSLRGVARHPLRASLAALSIAVGIATLVTIVSGELSWGRALDGWYQLRGVDVIQVRRSFSGISPRLPTTDDLMQRFLRASPAVTVATVVADGWLPVKADSKEESCRVRGLSAGFARIFGTRLLRGRFFTEAEQRERAPVCILDGELSQMLFGKEDMLGKRIRVGGRRLQVVGIAHWLDSGGLRGPVVMAAGEIYQENFDNYRRRTAGLVVPLSTARRSLSLPVLWLAARADDHTAAIPQMGRHFGFDPTAQGERQWLVSLAREKASVVRSRQRARLFIGLAGILVLLASGIAVASIMYVAVSERQREIGVHRALGAAQGIVAQTLALESIWLGALGGLVGMGLGLLGARYLGTVSFPHESDGMPNPVTLATSVLPHMAVRVQWQTLTLAAAAALAVAAAAGFLPASEAAHLDPGQAIARPQVARHRLRRALTGLQLAVGIAAVLLLSSIHEGIALEQLGQIWQFSQADTVYTDLSLPYSSRQMPPIADPMKELVRNADQVKAIARECPAFRSIESQVYLGNQPLKYGRYTGGSDAFITGVTPGYFDAEGMRVVEGRLFSPQEAAGGGGVVVLTDRAAGMLEMDSAAGRTVRIGGLPFVVVGVVRVGAEGASQHAYVPVTSVPRSWVAGYPYTESRLRAHLKSESNWSAAQRQLSTALGKRLPKQTMDHLELRGNIPDRNRLSGLRRAAALRASVIGFSTLLIALIGLVNMLLVSVSEQAREIGLRRALGATRSAIALGVVLEAVLICLPGCVVGLALGMVASKYCGQWAHLATAVPLFWIVVSAGTALVGGLVASLIPALRAALLHPVEALRQE